MEINDAFLMFFFFASSMVESEILLYFLQESESVFYVCAFQQIIVLVANIRYFFHDELALLKVVI